MSWLSLPVRIVGEREHINWYNIFSLLSFAVVAFIFIFALTSLAFPLFHCTPLHSRSYKQIAVNIFFAFFFNVLSSSSACHWYVTQQHFHPPLLSLVWHFVFQHCRLSSGISYVCDVEIITYKLHLLCEINMSLPFVVRI